MGILGTQGHIAEKKGETEDSRDADGIFNDGPDGSSALPNGNGLRPPVSENEAIEGSDHRAVEELSFSQACDTDPSWCELLNYRILHGVLWVGCWRVNP